MEDYIYGLLKMSVNASWLVMAVIILRLILNKAPKSVRCILWALVGIRLICPVSIESVWSLIPKLDSVVEESDVQYGSYQNGEFVIREVLTVKGTGNQLMIDTVEFTYLLTTVWLIGVILMICYAFRSYWKIHRKVMEAVPLKDNIRMCDHIASPFILGIVKPCIYVPSEIEEKQLEYVIAHEQSHLKRRDHWWKPLGYVLLTVHWFNPFIWAAYILLCRDIELACDERVVKNMGEEYRKAYSTALLECSVPRHMIAACPLAFGEVGVKERIKSVLNYRRPTIWILLIAGIACMVVVVGFMTNPLQTEVEADMDAFLSEVILEQNRSEYTSDYYACEEHTILGVQTKGKESIIYAMVLYAEYQYLNGEIVLESTSHVPAAVTIRESEEGTYSLVEYWLPGDGTAYQKDIHQKFPWKLWMETDTQDYIEEHQKRCDAQAEFYFGVNELDIEKGSIP